jgi:hypothetical protein
MVSVDTTQDSPFPERKTREDAVIASLRQKGPVTEYELPRAPKPSESRWIGELGIETPPERNPIGGETSVYYLYGDERRAVRKYITENTEIVKVCMGGASNPIKTSMEKYWWQMFCEEWTWQDTE